MRKGLSSLYSTIMVVQREYGGEGAEVGWGENTSHPKFGDGSPDTLIQAILYSLTRSPLISLAFLSPRTLLHCHWQGITVAGSVIDIISGSWYPGAAEYPWEPTARQAMVSGEDFPSVFLYACVLIEDL